MNSQTVMGIPIHVYYANKKAFDLVEAGKAEDPNHGFGKPADAFVTNNGYVATQGPIYNLSNESAFNCCENHLHSPFRKI